MRPHSVAVRERFRRCGFRRVWGIRSRTGRWRGYGFTFTECAVDRLYVSVRPPAVEGGDEVERLAKVGAYTKVDWLLPDDQRA